MDGILFVRTLNTSLNNHTYTIAPHHHSVNHLDLSNAPTSSGANTHNSTSIKDLLTLYYTLRTLYTIVDSTASTL